MLTRSQYLSGKVRRWHTHHKMDQNNADHSWGVAMILLSIHPEPSLDLIRAAMMHDCGEYFTGDVPGFAKQRNPELEKQLKFAEADAMGVLGFRLPELSETDQAWLSLADALEAIMFLRHCSGASESDIQEYFPGLVAKANKWAQVLDYDISNVIEGTFR